MSLGIFVVCLSLAVKGYIKQKVHHLRRVLGALPSGPVHGQQHHVRGCRARLSSYVDQSLIHVIQSPDLFCGRSNFKNSMPIVIKFLYHSKSLYLFMIIVPVYTFHVHSICQFKVLNMSERTHTSADGTVRRWIPST
jgi:hypothetical protein